ncbi:hypothetical protein MMC31_001091 [Peltigera leucophlebia]|nr:hypothetical protein [Peltigera leucophlebia]
MVFSSPAWVPGLSFDPPDNIPISEFMLNEKYGRHPFAQSRQPFTCGIAGVGYSALQVRDRVEHLARALTKEFGWDPNSGSEWDKVVGVFSLNTIDTLTLSWAVHSVSGIMSPANASYTVAELEYQLKSSGTKALFTCVPLLSVALEAAARCRIPKNRIYLLSVSGEIAAAQLSGEHKTVDQLIGEGQKLPKLKIAEWHRGQGARQTAFLCYSSGTSGLPKGVMISHRNVIANVLQLSAFEKPSRLLKGEPQTSLPYTDVVLGLLPQSHAYALVVVCHLATYRGDQVVSLPKFEILLLLGAIERFKIRLLYLVPPIIVAMSKNKSLLDKYDLSSVTAVFTGAAPLGAETAEDLHNQWPRWNILQLYGATHVSKWHPLAVAHAFTGLTETGPVVCATAENDICYGSSGALLPMIEARLMSPEGNEITAYDKPGELVVRSPSVALGYLNNEISSKKTFRDGWMWTGDEAVVRKSPNGNEHVWIVDRIKELIKVKGHQVAPAELEAHLLTHPAVADAAVISIPNEATGELPKAFIVKSAASRQSNDNASLIRDIEQHVEKSKASYKWLRGGVEFIDVVPKSSSGKILRRLLKGKERESRRLKGGKL